MADALAAHLLHVVAVAGVACSSPARARAAVGFFARHLRPLDVGASRHVAALLEPMGSCLTRALVVASRLPNSAIVIGIERESDRLDAHAWVEVDGTPLRQSDVWGHRLASWMTSRRGTVETVERSLQ